MRSRTLNSCQTDLQLTSPIHHAILSVQFYTQGIDEASRRIVLNREPPGGVRRQGRTLNLPSEQVVEQALASVEFPGSRPISRFKWSMARKEAPFTSRQCASTTRVVPRET